MFMLVVVQSLGISHLLVITLFTVSPPLAIVYMTLMLAFNKSVLLLWPLRIVLL